MLNDLGYRLRALARRGQMERDLEAEMRHHAATTGQERGLEQTKEGCRDARGVGGVETTLRDVRFGWRGLRHAPGFALPAGLTLALGLGATMAIFAVANAVLLQPLAYPGAGRLVLVRERIRLLAPQPIQVSAPDIAALRAGGAAFDGVGAYTEEHLDLAGAGAATRVRAARVTAELFPLLGVRPQLGHNFTAAQDQPGQHVVILSNALWRQRLGGDAQAVGRVVRLEGEPYTVAGVMPPGFEFPPRGLADSPPTALWVPMGFTPAELTDVADNFDNGVVARLRPGATLAEARAQMAVTAGRIQQTWQKKLGAVPGLHLEVLADPLRSVVVAPSRGLMTLLLAAAGLLLLLSCANVVNLFLVRTGARRREMALRAALGASRGRLIRQGVTEAAVLALAAGGVGLGLAWAGLRGLTAAAPASLPQVRDIGLSWGVGLAGLGLSLLVGLACGLLPALLTSRANLQNGLRESGPRTTHTRREARWQAGLVVAQVAIAFILMCGAGLLVRSFVRAEAGGAGLRATGLLAASLSLPKTPYPAPAQERAFFERLEADLAAQPGVTAVAVASDLPTESNWNRVFSVEHPTGRAPAKLPDSTHSLVLGDYFRALGAPLLQGRNFTAVEEQGQANVLMVSASMAARFWPGGHAVGQRIKWGPSSSTSPWLTVVGVVGDVKSAALDQPSGFHTYEPYAQACQGSATYSVCRNLDVVVRSALPLAATEAQVRSAARQLDPAVPVTKLRSMAAVLDASLTPRRFNTTLIATFGVAALLLSAVGLYGVLAFVVSGQRHEIGVRMAMGARPRAVANMVLGRGARMAMAGLGLGAVGAWLLNRYVATLLYRTTTADAATWTGVAALLLAVALAACYVPARRASRVSPLVALRE